ncbi:uncharacterized protein BKCO1_3600043 [Diplodia corticola]|uniref:Uncharacterized protein n=1 Tax=Diplodia corticola TaxID=236234 RepID=A0A1J9QUX6_9PEZI|nr:uncharacterized protein BKCO1_3600043 [Diplodia corticola]OJD32790.1 hypothetical protein BKCO1_3600043 [Diplodia corticola]
MLRAPVSNLARARAERKSRNEAYLKPPFELEPFTLPPTFELHNTNSPRETTFQDRSLIRSQLTMASKYSAAAINGLSDAEKLRFALAYLHHHDPKNVDWAGAAAHSGSKSKESFKVMFNQTLKKLDKQSEGAADADVASPAAKSTKAVKRKKADLEDDDEEAPTPKKRGRKKAVPKNITPEKELQAEEGLTLKEEEALDDAIKGVFDYDA